MCRGSAFLLSLPIEEGGADFVEFHPSVVFVCILGFFPSSFSISHSHIMSWMSKLCHDLPVRCRIFNRESLATFLELDSWSSLSYTTREEWIVHSHS